MSPLLGIKGDVCLENAPALSSSRNRNNYATHFRQDFIPPSRWIDGRSITEIAPCLFQAVGPRTRKRRTVYEGLQDRRWVKDITGALMVQVVLYYLNIWERLRLITLDDSIQDKVLWKWMGDHCFSTASAYGAFFIGQYVIPRTKTLWKSRAPAKCKFFV